MEQNYQVLERAQQKPVEWETWNEVEVISAAYRRPRFANWTLLRSVRWSEERKTSRVRWNDPSWWRGSQEIYGINCHSAPPSQKTGFKHSERGITASKKRLLWAWRWHRRKWGSWRDVFAFEGVGKEECRAKAWALLPCLKPWNVLFTPAQAAATVPVSPTAPAGKVTCPEHRAKQAAANSFLLVHSIWSPYFAAFPLMQRACGE